MNLGPSELIVILFIFTLSVVPIALGIWAIVDTLGYPDGVWAAAGQTKQTWLILNIVGMLFCVVLPIVYLATVRPKLRAVRPV